MSDQTPFIMRHMPACPTCGSTNVKTRSSRTYDYGTRKAYAKCQQSSCGIKFVIIWELPKEREESYLP